MSERSEGHREGSLEAPTHHPIRWKEPGFYDEAALNAELPRVFDVCHGCRRCVSLCNAFPTLFDLVDNSPTLEVDGVDEDLPRDTADKTSSVHFLRFELDPEMRVALRGGAGLCAGIDHGAYRHALEPIPSQIRDALLADLD